MCKTLVRSAILQEWNIIQDSKPSSNLLGLNAVHRNYICKVRTSNIRFQIETKNILWNEYLCST
jgi:hypothetical protein